MGIAEFIAYLDGKGIIDASKLQDDSSDGLENELRLQWHVYLARYFGLDFGYEFDSNMEGPCSDKLTKDMFALDLSKIASGPAPKELREKEFLSVLSDKDKDWPLVATTIMQETAHFSETTRDDIYHRRFKHTREFIDKVYEDLIKLNLYQAQ